MYFSIEWKRMGEGREENRWMEIQKSFIDSHIESINIDRAIRSRRHRFVKLTE